MVFLLPSYGLRNASVGGPLTDAENDEFRRIGRRHTDQADQPPVIEVVLVHGRAIAADKVGLLGLGAQQRAGFPYDEEEIFDGVANVGPQALVVWLKHRPLGALVDGML